MHVIGVAGQAQMGKDTMADHLRTILNDRRCENYWQRTAFAKSVKQIFMDTFNKDAYYVEKWKVRQDVPPDLDQTVRKALQFIGDGFRQIKASIWIDLMFRDKTFPKIISDARYVNELRAIRKHGGYVVLVVNPAKVNDDPNGSEAQMKLFAEHALKVYKGYNMRQFQASAKECVYVGQPPDGWNFVDYVIINDDTIEDFHDRIEQFIASEVEAFFKEAV